MGLSEVRWPGKGEMSKDGYKIIYSGMEDGGHQQGVAMILGEEAARALIGYKLIGPRMMKARFNTASGKATIIQVYAPTTSATEQEIEEFYEELQQMVQEISSQDITIIMGDFNARVGRDWRTWRGALGKQGYGEENERGERLLSFCQ